VHYSPLFEKCPLEYNPFKACVGPRPIGWLSTVSPDGIDNLAPFSQFNNLSYDPPLVMVSCNQTTDDAGNVYRKDTVRNIEATGCFVYNIVPYELREKMNLTAVGYPPEVDEFEKAGLTKLDSIRVKAKRVAESPIQFECEYLQTIRIPGNNPRATADIIIARVVEIHIADDIILPNGKIDIQKVRPLGRLGYYDYTSVQEVFTMVVPVSPERLAAMEGKPQ